MANDDLFAELFEMKKCKLTEMEEKLSRMGKGSKARKQSDSTMLDSGIEVVNNDTNGNSNNAVLFKRNSGEVESIATVYENAADVSQNPETTPEVILSDSTDYGSSDDLMNIANLSSLQLNVTDSVVQVGDKQSSQVERNNRINFLIAELHKVMPTGESRQETSVAPKVMESEQPQPSRSSGTADT